MSRISGWQPNFADPTNIKPVEGRGSRTSNVAKVEVTNIPPNPFNPEVPGSFASLLQVWDPFTGRNYAAGQAPKTVLHSQDFTSPASPASSISPPITALTPQGVPDSIRLDGVDVESVSFNSARSVTTTNASYNRKAVEGYEYQVQNWKDNSGRRWLNGQWTKTEIPPPPPVLKETVFDNVLARIRSGQVDITPIPYYMGNQQAGQIYEYNAPLSYDGQNTTTYAVNAAGQPLGGVIATPQGQQFASNVTPSVIGKPRTA